MLVVGGIFALALIAQASPGAPAPEPVIPVNPVPSVAEPASPEPPVCDEPGRAPDPRCNDTLDGREPAAASPGRQAARAVLAPPRAAARLVLLPVVETTEAAERHNIFPWLRALTTSDDGKVGMRPDIQYATGFAPTVGFFLFYRRLPVPTSEITARFKAGSADILRAEVALRGPRWLGLTLGALLDRRNDRLFAGIGNPAPGAQSLESRYRGNIYRAEALWLTPNARYLSLALRAGVEGREYDSTEIRGGPSIADVYGAPPASCAARGQPVPCTDPALVPGFDIDRRLLYQRARLGLDLRPPGRDGHGVEMGLEGSINHGVVADPSRYARLSFDGLAAFGGVDRTLLFRFVAAVAEPLGRVPIPFDDLISPCGGMGIRGLPDGLLRDRSGMVGTAEYRWLISSALDATLFVDEGAVAGPWFSGLQGESFHTSVGAGLRFYRGTMPRYWDETANQGVQIAYAPGRSVRVLLTAALF